MEDWGKEGTKGGGGALLGMDFARLSAESRAAFDADGFLAVRSALSQEQIARYTELCDRTVASRSDLAEGAYASTNLGRWHRAELASAPELRPLLAHSPTVPFIVQLLSANIHLHTAAALYKRPQTPDGEAERDRGWHR
eukprot:COSAG04_NODE_452_length_14117_cov_2.295834_4_plen_139_part_00